MTRAEAERLLDTGDYIGAWDTIRDYPAGLDDTKALKSQIESSLLNEQVNPAIAEAKKSEDMGNYREAQNILLPYKDIGISSVDALAGEWKSAEEALLRAELSTEISGYRRVEIHQRILELNPEDAVARILLENALENKNKPAPNMYEFNNWNVICPHDAPCFLRTSGVGITVNVEPAHHVAGFMFSGLVLDRSWQLICDNGVGVVTSGLTKDRLTGQASYALIVPALRQSQFCKVELTGEYERWFSANGFSAALRFAEDSISQKQSETSASIQSDSSLLILHSGRTGIVALAREATLCRSLADVAKRLTALDQGRAFEAFPPSGPECIDLPEGSTVELTGRTYTHQFKTDGGLADLLEARYRGEARWFLAADL